MSFLNYGAGAQSGYLDYDSEIARNDLDQNTIRSFDSRMTLPGTMSSQYTRMVPFEGTGLYSPYAVALRDDCYLEPFSGHYASQGNCAKLASSAKVFRPMTTSSNPAQTADPTSVVNMRQNGNKDLPDHFSRFGYNDKTGGCANNYCLGNHPGRWIVGENMVGKGIYESPPNCAPKSWYDKQKRMEEETYWFPHNPRPLEDGYKHRQY